MEGRWNLEGGPPLLFYNLPLHIDDFMNMQKVNRPAGAVNGLKLI